MADKNARAHHRQHPVRHTWFGWRFWLLVVGFVLIIAYAIKHNGDSRTFGDEPRTMVTEPAMAPAEAVEPPPATSETVNTNSATGAVRIATITLRPRLALGTNVLGQ